MSKLIELSPELKVVFDRIQKRIKPKLFRSVIGAGFKRLNQHDKEVEFDRRIHVIEATRTVILAYTYEFAHRKFANIRLKLAFYADSPERLRVSIMFLRELYRERASPGRKHVEGYEILFETSLEIDLRTADDNLVYATIRAVISISLKQLRKRLGIRHRREGEKDATTAGR